MTITKRVPRFNQIAVTHGTNLHGNEVAVLFALGDDGCVYHFNAVSDVWEKVPVRLEEEVHHKDYAWPDEPDNERTPPHE